MSDREARKAIDDWNEEHPDQKVEYDFGRESGKEFNAETMQLEDKPLTRFSRREKGIEVSADEYAKIAHQIATYPKKQTGVMCLPIIITIFAPTSTRMAISK